MQSITKLQPVILSGGFGTRLWPLSREEYPKQYINLDSANKFSLLQNTLKRLEGFKNIEAPIVICNEKQRFIVAEQLRAINVIPKSIILEPYGKNTAPAIAIAALKATEFKEDYFLLILSSDHDIKNPINFIKAVETGLNDAKKHKLITFGIVPTKPETGYGYIQISNDVKKTSFQSIPIKKFIEKPDLKTAKSLISNKNVLWNSGIFLFKSSLIIELLREHQPELLEICSQAFSSSSIDLDFQRLNKDKFYKCPNISIDIAVMEKTKKANVIALDAGWNDIGNWDALWEIATKNEDNNVVIGDIYTKNTKNSYLNSKNRLLVGIGIDNLIIVQTEDATLIANKGSSQEIKSIINKLNLEGRSETKMHRKVFRPWGYFNLIDKGQNWLVKEICVNSKSSLSLQKHKYRSEHWIILEGTATVTLNNQKHTLHKNQSTYIPIGAKHRLSNHENAPLKIIEVQCGNYLGEDDIFRFDDNYGRISKDF